MTSPTAPPALPGLAVFQRGWLSSNNVLLDAGDAGAVLIDSSHTVHAAQTVDLLRRALRGRPLLKVINTHLHSDHCGGNATVQRTFGCRMATPASNHQAARDWDAAALSYEATGQICERFSPDEAIEPGSTLHIGQRHWQVLGTPGHDPHAVVLFDAEDGVLISADTLWENGFGVIFPELDGANQGAGFEDQAAVLDLIERLRPRWVIPGHGAPFGDVANALGRARQRLAGFRAEPARHYRHAMRVLVKYHLMEVSHQGWADYVAWFCASGLSRQVWERLGRPEGSLPAWGERTAYDLVAAGALGTDELGLIDKP
jgi:glyoxylase-like metal-dependent hydrolase (beta-lactamase superfamily II)